MCNQNQVICDHVTEAMKILIVDDSNAMQNIMTKSLRSLGYKDDNYYYADNGAAAMEIIRDVRPKLVICDLHMPVMDGIQLVEQLRQDRDPTKIVIVSIDDNQDTVDRIMAVGSNAFLKKPFNNDELYRTLMDVLSNERIDSSKPVYKLNDLAPSQAALVRVLSSFFKQPITLESIETTAIDYDQWPFYIGSLMDQQKHVALSFLFDCRAVNTIGSRIRRSPPEQAASHTTGHIVDEETESAMMVLLGLLSSISRSPDSNELLNPHGGILSTEKGTPTLKRFIDNHSTDIRVCHIRAGNDDIGKLIMLCP